MTSYVYTPKEDARLIIRHRAREVVALARVTENMGEYDEATRLVAVADWLEAAADTFREMDD